jgi:transcriptional regulator with XRE-family HTH domain
MPGKLWSTNGERLRELRNRHGLSQRRLAELAEVDPQTIAGIESGERGSRTDTLQKLAGPLKINWESLLSDKEQARLIRSHVRMAHDLEPESPIDLLSLAQADRPDPKLETRHGLLDAFGPAEMAHTISAPRVREGDRYFVFGEVCRDRPMARSDETVLGLPALECARFEIVRQIAAELPLYAVTVFARSREQTRALQEHWRSAEVVHLVVRVVVACAIVDDPDHVLVTNLDGRDRLRRPAIVDGARWPGFEMIASRFRARSDEREWLPQPWALVVEEIAEGRIVPVEPKRRVEPNEDQEEIVHDFSDIRLEPEHARQMTIIEPRGGK